MSQKIIIIGKCDECPHAVLDPQEIPEHWGKWVCTAEATAPDEARLLDGVEVSYDPPPCWCPLEDYR